jgi:DNA repair ATPase RecN
MSDIADTIQETIEPAENSGLNGMIALFVAVVATLMALCNVKDGNVTQAMQQAQAKSIDQWAYFQAKGTKEHIAANTAELFAVQLDLAPDLKPEQRAKIEARIAEQKALVEKYQKEKESIQKEAKQAAEEYDALNVHDDQFDLAEACFSIAISLAGITALTKKRWLFALAAVLAVVGGIYGLAGFLHWQLHSDLMAKLLG